MLRAQRPRVGKLPPIDHHQQQQHQQLMQHMHHQQQEEEDDGMGNVGDQQQDYDENGESPMRAGDQ